MTWKPSLPIALSTCINHHCPSAGHSVIERFAKNWNGLAVKLYVDGIAVEVLV